MENKEKATQLVQKWAVEGYAEASTYFASCEMAEWKDEQFANKFNCGKVLRLRRKVYKKGYDKAIDKVCEWLKENISLYVSIECKDWEKYELLIEKEELITELKKAMEEE